MGRAALVFNTLLKASFFILENGSKMQCNGILVVCEENGKRRDAAKRYQLYTPKTSVWDLRKGFRCGPQCPLCIAKGFVESPIVNPVLPELPS